MRLKLRRGTNKTTYLPRLVWISLMNEMHWEEYSVLPLKLLQIGQKVFSPHAQTQRKPTSFDPPYK